jgi:hypothetical protein
MRREPQNLHKFFVPDHLGDVEYEGEIGRIEWSENRALLELDLAEAGPRARRIRSMEWVKLHGKGMYAHKAVEMLMEQV